MLTTTDKRFKPLTTRVNKISGRSNGQIVVRHRNGFNKRLYRFIDLKRLILPNSLGLILRHQYNPKPRNHIALVCFAMVYLHIYFTCKNKRGDLIQNYTILLNNPVIQLHYLNYPPEDLYIISRYDLLDQDA